MAQVPSKEDCVSRYSTRGCEEDVCSPRAFWALVPPRRPEEESSLLASLPRCRGLTSKLTPNATHTHTLLGLTRPKEPSMQHDYKMKATNVLSHYLLPTTEAST